MQASIKMKCWIVPLNSNLNQLKSMTVSLEGTKFQLKPVTVNDITLAFINWLNDAEIMQHTEQQFRTTTLEDASDYVALMAESKTDLFYGLFFEGTHIGSIKLGKINPNHKTADLSYIIGDKSFWGMGIASKMIKKMVSLAFERLELEKIVAGVYATNLASIRVLEKNRFVCEGKQRNQFIFRGKRIDGLIHGRLKPDWLGEK